MNENTSSEGPLPETFEYRRFYCFGKAVWDHIVDNGGDFIGSEISEDILPLAESAGLCHRVKYNPRIHGEDIDADPGDEIWWWGEVVSTNQREAGV